MRRTLLNTEDIHLTIDISTGHPVIGLVLYKKLTHNYLKALKIVQEDLLVMLGAFGFETVLTTVEEGNEKAIRLNKLLGYEEEITADGYTWLAQDII